MGLMFDEEIGHLSAPRENHSAVGVPNHETVVRPIGHYLTTIARGPNYTIRHFLLRLVGLLPRKTAREFAFERLRQLQNESGQEQNEFVLEQTEFVKEQDKCVLEQNKSGKEQTRFAWEQNESVWPLNEFKKDRDKCGWEQTGFVLEQNK